MDALPTLALPAPTLAPMGMPALPGALPATGAEGAATTATSAFAQLLEALAVPATPATDASTECRLPEADAATDDHQPAGEATPPTPDAALDAQLAWQPLPVPTVPAAATVAADAATDTATTGATLAPVAPAPPGAPKKLPPAETDPAAGARPRRSQPGPIEPHVLPSAPAAAPPATEGRPLSMVTEPTAAPMQPQMLAELTTRAPAPAVAPAPAPAPSPLPTTAEVHAPVESPGFAPELAATVSVLARDGLHRAELRMHPVELGPVAVQITIEGSQARVDFGAEMAATRAAIEASWPALAASLRDEGLVLAGGSVSAQAQHGGDGRQGTPDQRAASFTPDGREPRAALADTAPRTVVTRSLRAGGVDLYA